MSIMMVRPRIKADIAPDVEAAVKTMFAAIAQARPRGVRYASCRLGDGADYVILLEIEDGIENPLPTVPEWREFQEKLKSWLAEPPTPEPLTVIGSYNLF